MARHHPRENSGFDEQELEEAERESAQDAYSRPAPPVAAPAYDDEQAQIRRAEQESLRDSYVPGAQAGYGGDQPRYQEQGRRQEYQEGYGRPADEQYGHADRPRPPTDNAYYAPPPGPPPRDDGDVFYTAPEGPPPVDDYGRPIQSQGEEHHRKHHHHEEGSEYTEYNSGARTSDAGGGYSGAAGAAGAAHHGAAAEYFGNEPAQPRPRPQQDYQPPQQEYQPPKQEYQRPQQEYQRPQQEYQRPQQEYQRPQQEYQRPQQEYQRPQQASHGGGGYGAQGQYGDDAPPPPPPKPQQAPVRPNLQAAATFAGQHHSNSVEDQQMFNAAAAHVAHQQATGQVDEDDQPTPTVHPHTVSSSTPPTQMGQAAAMQALQHLTGGSGAAGGGMGAILGSLAGGGGGAGGALSALTGGSGGGAPAGPAAGGGAGGGAGAPSASGAGANAGPAAPASPYEKLIAVAMMEASKMFDKNGSGDPVAKQQAIQSAASTVVKLMSRYESGGSGGAAQFEPGEIQGLFSAFMKII